MKENENTLRLKSKTKLYGTHPINVIECAKSYGLEACVGFLNLSELLELVEQRIPVITNILKHSGDEFYIHSVVVYRMKENIVYILDPEEGEKKLDRDLYERLWGANDCIGIIIKKLL